MASPNGEGTEQNPQQIVKLVTPSVVRIRTQGTALTVFGQVAQENGTATGIVLDADGHILTNDHVVTADSDKVADSITVDLPTGKSAPATLVGRDQNSDLAVLQVKSSDLTPVTFAPSGSTEVGEPVLAIGYALDIVGTPTVTSGVVSALNRAFPETIQSSSGASQIMISDAIQTDAAVNLGNSGGPLVNLKGEVVGINTAGLLGGESQGIFFAISADDARPIVQSLITKGKVDRGYIGITTQTITEEAAREQDLPVTSGIAIVDVQSGTPADKAGLKPGDIIVKINDYDIHNTGDLQQALAQDPPSTKVTIAYYRGRDQHSLDLTLSSRPDSSG